MVSRAFSSAEMGCQIGQSETGCDSNEGSSSRMDCCATTFPGSDSEPEDGIETCAMDSAASSTLSGKLGPGDSSDDGRWVERATTSSEGKARSEEHTSELQSR